MILRKFIKIVGARTLTGFKGPTSKAGEGRGGNKRERRGGDQGKEMRGKRTERNEGEKGTGREGEPAFL